MQKLLTSDRRHSESVSSSSELHIVVYDARTVILYLVINAGRSVTMH